MPPAAPRRPQAPAPGPPAASLLIPEAWHRAQLCWNSVLPRAASPMRHRLGFSPAGGQAPRRREMHVASERGEDRIIRRNGTPSRGIHQGGIGSRFSAAVRHPALDERSGPRLRRIPKNGRSLRPTFAARLPRQAARRPLHEAPGPETLVELDRGLVPVEDRPLHPAAAPLVRQLRARWRRSALPTPRPRRSGTTKRSSRYSPGRARKVEKEEKKTAKPAGTSSSKARTHSAAGRPLSGNKAVARSASLASTSWASFSYTASARMKSRISGMSSGVAARRFMGGTQPGEAPGCNFPRSVPNERGCRRALPGPTLDHPCHSSASSTSASPSAGRLILDKINFQIDPGERVCLLGRNGSGKSTLMRVIAGEMKPDTGDVFRQPGSILARLTQEVPAEVGGTVADIITSGLRPQAGHEEDWERDVLVHEPDRPPEAAGARGLLRALGRAQAPGPPRPRPRGQARPPPPRRADQPPRPRVHPLAGGVPPRGEDHPLLRHPRPRLPAQARDPDRRARPRAPHRAGPATTTPTSSARRRSRRPRRSSRPPSTRSWPRRRSGSARACAPSAPGPRAGSTRS
jgi:energy-coupling factor transporter ATP-binding protein EcfA2